MNRYTRFAFFLLSALLLMPLAVQAGTTHDGRRIVWAQKPNSKNGLFTTKNFFISHGININASAMYYFGDVDNEGLAFHGGFNRHNLSFGGSLNFSYSMPASVHCNLRYSLMFGTLGGNNEKKFNKLGRDDYRKFKSIIIQPAFGVEIYPFTNAGFYIYAGVGVTASIITNYEFYYYKRVGSGKERTLLKGSTFGILPMAQLGLGYNWRLSESWAMGLEIMIQEGLIDTKYVNLDAWPMDGSQNSDGVDLGSTFGTWVDRNGKKHIHWNDGWFQVGITVSYRWNNCEQCRILDNYTHIKPQRNSKKHRNRW